MSHTNTHTNAHTALSHTKAQAASPLSHAAGKQQMAGQAFQLEYGVQQQPVRALTFRGQKSNMKTDCACLPLSLSLSPSIWLHLARVSFATRAVLISVCQLDAI